MLQPIVQYFIDPTGVNPGWSYTRQPGLGLTERVEELPQQLLSSLKAERIRVINVAAQAEVDNYLSAYPDFERLTWAIQTQEAELWQRADQLQRTAALVPWCANAALNRKDADGNGMSLDEFMRRVVTKIEAFKTISSNAAGTRQSLEDAINIATTRDEVNAVAWPT